MITSLMIVVDDHAINIIENKPEQENEFYKKDR